MFIRRLLIALAALAVTGPAATTAVAQAKAPKLPSFGKKYLVYVKGSQKTTFNKPEHETYENACNKFSGSSSASESITFHSKKPEKMLVVTSPILSVMSPPSATPDEDPGMDLVTSITRHSKTITKVTKKSGCGEPSSSTVHGGSDCGTRKPSWVANVQGGYTKTTLSVNDAVLAPLSKETFDDCDVPAPDTQFDISPETGRLTEVQAKNHRKKLGKLKKGQRIVLSAHKTFTRSLDKSVTKTQTVTWQVRMLRIK